MNKYNTDAFIPAWGVLYSLIMITISPSLLFINYRILFIFLHVIQIILIIIYYLSIEYIQVTNVVWIYPTYIAFVLFLKLIIRAARTLR